MKINFWGTRGSAPRSSNGDNEKFPSHQTTCVEIIEGESKIIVDAGTGFDRAARHHHKLNKDQPINLLLTHFHWDHLMGLVMIYDLYVKGLKINIHSPLKDLETTILKIFQKPFCPLQVDIIKSVFTFHHIAKTKKIHDFTVEEISVPHAGETYGFLVANHKRVLVIPDVNLAEFISQPSLGISNCDLLICDTFHRDNDKKKLGSMGHSSVTEVTAFANLIQAKSLALFHYSPYYGDVELQNLLADAKKNFAETILSVDGHSIDI